MIKKHFFWYNVSIFVILMIFLIIMVANSLCSDKYDVKKVVSCVDGEKNKFIDSKCEKIENTCQEKMGKYLTFILCILILIPLYFVMFLMFDN